MQKTFVVMLSVSLLVGCAPATRLIVVPSTTKAVTTKDTATLLVGNSLGYPVVNLLDGQGKVLGQLTGRSHTVLQVPPGHVKLYAVLERNGKTGDRVEGDVETGKVYYVTVGFRWGGASLTVLSERTDKDAWKERKTYETDLDNKQLDSARLSGLVQDLGDTKQILGDIDGVVNGFNDADSKKARQLVVADGEVVQ
jgi:hypothetical protein